MICVAAVLAAAAAQTDLRLLLSQFAVIQPRTPWHSSCYTTQDPECTGGAAALSARMRHLERGAHRTVKVVGYDRKAVPLEHPNNYSVLNEVWERLRIDVALMAEPYYLHWTFQRPDVFLWLQRSPVPVLAGNLRYDTTDRTFLGFRATLQSQVLVDTGGFKVGLIALFPDDYWTSTIPRSLFAAPMAEYLRRRGAGSVIVLCLGAEGVWKRSDWESLAGIVDVVVPPSCVDSGCEGHRNETLTVLNGTWLLPTSASGRGLDEGHVLEQIDFQLVDGALRPTAVEVVRISEPLPASMNDSAYREDAQWLEQVLADANEHNPVVVNATAPLLSPWVTLPGPDDNVCRRDICPHREMLGRAVRRVLPDYQIFLFNGGSFRRGWDTGEVRRRLVRKLTYTNTLCSFNTTGPDLWRFLEKFIAPVNFDGSYNSSSSLRGGFPQPYGLRYEYDPARPRGERLLSVTVLDREAQEWRPLVRTQHYSVVLPSFTCDGGDSSDLLQLNGTLVRHEDNTIPALLEEFLMEQGTYAPVQNETAVFINDTRPRWMLPPLQAEDCSRTQRYVAQWEECFDCPQGTAQSAVDPAECIALPSSDPVWIWPVVAVAVTLAVLGVPVGWRYSRSWRQLRHLRSANVMAVSVAESIASLRLEEVAHIREIPNKNELQQAFADVIDLITEYRSFLPQALRGDDPKGADECPVDAGTDALRSELSSAASSRSSVANTRWDNLQLAQTDKSLDQKKVTVLWCGLTNFHDHFMLGGPGAVAGLVTGVVSAANAFRGVLDEMTGDRFMFTYGAAALHSSRETAAGATALDLCRTVCAGHGKCQPLVGIESGLCRIGNLGNASVRKVSVLGCAVSASFACMRMAALHDVRILSGSRFFESACTRFVHEAKGIWAASKFGQHGLYAVYELKQAREELENEEWMYQLATMESADPHAELHKSVQRVVQAGRLEVLQADDCDSAAEEHAGVLEPTPWAPLDVVL